MEVYEIVLFHRMFVNEEPEEFSLFPDVSEQGTVRMYARNEREAVAKALVRVFGLERMRILEELGAPDFLVAAETDILAISQRVQPCDLWCGQLCYTNGVETWYFSVTPVELPACP
jgi:hypothetical protein